MRQASTRTRIRSVYASILVILKNSVKLNKTQISFDQVIDVAEQLSANLCMLNEQY